MMEAGGLAEAAAIPWRRRASDRMLRRDGRRWTIWSIGVVITFGAPTAALVAIGAAGGSRRRDLPRPRPRGSPHPGWPRGTGRGSNGSDRSEARQNDAEPGAEEAALGLLGDLLGHEERELVARTGLALQRGRFGTWLVGEEGALMVRPGGHRVDCWCVRVSESGDLPAGDRVAHLLLALREDEEGFATVANFNFSGAPWRVRLRLPRRSRPALKQARSIAGG